MSDQDDVAASFGALDGSQGLAPQGANDAAADVAASFNALDAPPIAPKVVAPGEKLPLRERIAHREDPSGNPNVQNPDSSALGVGQFMRGTWVPLLKRHRPDLAANKSDDEIADLRRDPDLSKDMIDAYAEENTPVLQKNHVPINDASISGAHWFGPQGYSDLYNADPKTPVEKIIGDHAASINGLSGKTAYDALAKSAQSVGVESTGKDYTIPEAMELAWQNAGKDAAHVALGVARGIYHWRDTLDGMHEIGKGLYSKLEEEAGETQDPVKKAQDEAVLNALINTQKQNYGTWQKALNHFAEHPAETAFDASTLASGAGGALGVTGKIASKVGLAGVGAGIGAAGRVASAVGNATNPLSLVGATIARPIKVFDKAGDFVPKVDELVKRATGDAMGAADLADPTVKAKFADVLRSKGISEESVKEALLRSLDLKAPTPTVTGKMTSRAAADHVAKATADNNDAIDKLASSLGGTGAGADIGAALDSAHTNSINRATDLYNNIRRIPGSFGSFLPDQAGLTQRILSNWRQSGIPAASINSLAQTGHAQSINALRLLNDFWGKGRTITPGGKIDATEILEMRKALQKTLRAAQGSDIKGVADVINAFDGHIGDMSARGLFVNPATGAPMRTLGNRLAQANRAYAKHFDTYETMNGQNNPIVSAVRKLKAAQGRAGNSMRMPSGDTDLYAKAVGPLGRELLDPVKGADMYNSLMRATGNSPSVAAFVKSQLMDSVGKVKTPGNIAKLLADPNSSVAKALSADDLAQARHIHAASVINNTKPTFTSRLSSILRAGLGSAAAKGAAGYLGYSNVGLSGVLMGAGVEHLAEKGLGSLSEYKSMRGAPGRPIRNALQAAASTRLLKPVAAAAHYSEDPNVQGALHPPEIARAAGGKVDDEALAARLMSRFKSAKHATDATTKPLLNVPDAAIIRALDIAQEHL